MSTPQDPHGGDRDWGRPPAGGWGAVGPSDPTADPPTPALGTPAVSAGADVEGSGTAEGSGTGARTANQGWDPTGSEPQGSAAGPSQEDPSWRPGGASDWAPGGDRERTGAWDRSGSAWDTDGGTDGRGAAPWVQGGGDTGQDAQGWDPAGRAPGRGGWDPAAGRHGDGQQGGGSAGQGGWDPTAARHGGGEAGAGQGGWDATGGQQSGWDPRGGAPDNATAATTAVSAVRSRHSGSGGGGKSRLPLVIGGVVALVVVAAVLVVGFWKPGYFLVEQFDQQALQSGVTQVLSRDYGLEVTALSCPEGQEVTAGASFTCAATVDGENVTVPITVLDDQGTYQVGRV